VRFLAVVHDSKALALTGRGFGLAGQESPGAQLRTD
jgi:hypothetical protein